MAPAAPTEKIFDEAGAACAGKIKPYLEAAAFGIAPWPITGLALRIAHDLGLGIGADGGVTEAEGSPDDYDDVIKAVRILSED